MATINQVEKTDYNAVKINYTSKDYTNILEDLIESIPGITEKWSTTDENDPGMVLVKLMAILGDMLFYNLDMMSLEVYPNSVTQRKNAASIYKLIGYKMRWYKSATLEANIVNTYSNAATLPRFCTFRTEDGITYTTFNKQYELPSNMTNNGLEVLVELVQGTPITPSRITNNPYPEAGKQWHSIYGYNYSIDDVINNRIYLKDQNVDQDHIIVIDDANQEWVLQENVYLADDIGRFFEFGVDVNDNPYIEFVDYYKNFNISKFKIFYIKSDGMDGQIYENTLKVLTGNVWSRQTTLSTSTVYNVSNFIHFTNYASTLGYDPETPDEARKNSVAYLNTLDTLITLTDFEKATLRLPGVANVRATDVSNDPGKTVSFYVGDINQDGYIDKHDVTMLENYLADPQKYALTAYQKRLADINQDGSVTSDDLTCINAYLNGDFEKAGEAGIQKITTVETLNGFTVKLYILRDEAHEDVNEVNFASDVVENLKDYKVLPLTIEVDLNSINKYYWTVVGKFYTTEPLSRDELQNIIVNINNQLRYTYALDKVNFNTLINYKDIIDLILSVDSRIQMVDLEPITYQDEEGNEISKEQLTGTYKQVVPQLDDEDMNNNLFYKINLDNVPILPGSLMIRVDDGEYTLKDDSNGQIYNTDNILTRKGSIDYLTGEITLEFNAPLTSDLVINYTRNSTSIATYKNLNTNTFYFDTSSLSSDNVQTLI